MKVKIKTYTSELDYINNQNHTSEEVKPSVKEALKVCKKEISRLKDSSNFIGFRIEDMKGDKMHQLHNY